MPKQAHRQRYEVFLTQLREARLRAGMTQTDIAQKLGNTQTFISKCERGERRLDVVDLLDFLEAYGVQPADFMNEFSKRLTSQGSSNRRGRR